MRRGSIVVLATLIAFALIIVFGVIAINGDSPAQNKQQNKNGAHAPQLIGAYVGHLGEVSGEGVLAAAISRNGPAGVGVTAQRSISGDGLSEAAQRCANVALKGVLIDLLATGTLHGVGVAIIVASKTSSTGAQIAYITDLDQCTILYSERM